MKGTPEHVWPYYYLQWAILERAILDALGHITDTQENAKRSLQIHAIDWLWCDDIPAQFLSFIAICHELDLCCETTRNTITLGMQGRRELIRRGGKYQAPKVIAKQLFG